LFTQKPEFSRADKVLKVAGCIMLQEFGCDLRKKQYVHPFVKKTQVLMFDQCASST
jgi:hypothetical protein